MKEIFILIGFIEIILVIFMQWQIYIKKTIITFAASSYLIAGFLFALGFYKHQYLLFILALLTAFVRGFFIPHYMNNKLKKDVWRERELKPTIGVASSIIGSSIFVIIGYLIYHSTLYTVTNIRGGSIPIGLLFQGIFLMVSKNNAFLQLIGYIIMENSIFLFAGYLFSGLPFIVEAGILLDLIGVVIISGIIIRLREDKIPYVDNDFEEFKG